MKGNEKIPITAEAVALMKSRAGDRFSRYFVTPRIVKLDVFVAKFFSEKLLSNVFAKRISLSKDMEEAVKNYRPKKIIDFGAGYTTFDFEYALSHPDCEVIEIDFPSVISAKQKKLRQIKEDTDCGNIPNLHLVPADIISDSLPKLLKKYLSKKEKTLIYSVGVNTYLNSGQNAAMLRNVSEILNQSKSGSAYLSHDPTKVQVNKTSSFRGKILRGLVSIITGSRQHIHYSTESDLKRKLRDSGFKKINIVKRKPNNTIYLARL